MSSHKRLSISASDARKVGLSGSDPVRYGDRVRFTGSETYVTFIDAKVHPEFGIVCARVTEDGVCETRSTLTRLG